MCYSDFLVPHKFPNYMHNTKLKEYFEMYADHVKLKEHIQFRKEILKAYRAPNFMETGRWILKIKDLENDQVTEESYEGLLLCTVHHAHNYVPRFEGDDIFKGKIIHSQAYR